VGRATKSWYAYSGSRDELKEHDVLNAAFKLVGLVTLAMLSACSANKEEAEDTLIIGLGKRVAEMDSAPAVWGLLEDSNHSTFGVSGGYGWLDLKSNIQSKTFNPNVKFQLISPHLAQNCSKNLRSLSSV
jgi:hypothetical protein